MKKLLLFSAIGLIFISCKDKPVNYVLETLSANVYSGDSAQIVVSPNLEGITFHSSDEKIAVISTQGYVKGVTIGSADITVKHNGETMPSKCQVTVPARYPGYSEPCLIFGQNRVAIKACETHPILGDYSVNIHYDYTGDPYFTEVYYYAVKGWIGDEDSQNLTHVSAKFKSPTLLNSFDLLKENYVFKEKIGDDYFFLSKNDSVEVKYTYPMNVTFQPVGN